MGKEISPEKLLDMIRSILPSTARVGARRSKAAASRVVRHRVSAALHHEDAEETKFDLCEEADQRGNVRARQGADKLNHFMRWCESWTRGMTVAQALDAVRAVLPRNLIGDHAFSHWESHVKYRRRLFARDYFERQSQSRYDKTRHRLRQALSLDPGFPGRFNAAVKAKKEAELPRRMLHGLHDVDAFVHDVLHRHDYHLEERLLLDLLTEVEQYSDVECRSAGVLAGWPAGVPRLRSAWRRGRRQASRRDGGAPDRNRHGACRVIKLMKPDEPTPPTPPDAQEAPFEFGDRTVLALRAQSFAIENEYGTMILPNSPPLSLETTEIRMPATETDATDPILRLEEKIDTALRLIQSLQQQLDSIDSTLARALNR